MMKKKRIKWLDVAKAISIILVVMGHSGHAYLDMYLGWFRIPLFFSYPESYSNLLKLKNLLNGVW